LKNYKYKNAGIAGKFRLLHKAHVELILRAMSYTETLHVFIVDLPVYQRYASIEDLIACFDMIFAHLTDQNYEIHVMTEELSGLAWDTRLLELVPELEAMFDSKEPYDNILVQNQFIALNIGKTVSVTDIEQALYKPENFALIAEEFKCLLTKKVVIAYDNNAYAERLIAQVRMYFDAIIYEELCAQNNETLLLFPKRLMLFKQTCKQLQAIDRHHILSDIDHIVYLYKDDNLLVNVEAAQAEKYTILQYTTPDQDFNTLVDTINNVLKYKETKFKE